MARNLNARGRGLRKPKEMTPPRYAEGEAHPHGGVIVKILGTGITNQERREWQYQCTCSTCGAVVVKFQGQINAMCREKRGIFCRKCGYSKQRYYTPEEETEAEEKQEGRERPKISYTKWKAAAVAAIIPWFPAELLGGERPRVLSVRPGACL